MGWREEIVELHEFFEAWFLGTEDSLERVEQALGAEFTFVGPDGGETDRQATIDRLDAGRGHTSELRITTSEHRLLHQSDDVLMASYIEGHELAASTNRRLSTVVFTVDPGGPNGLRWLRVHETWLDRG